MKRLPHHPWRRRTPLSTVVGGLTCAALAFSAGCQSSKGGSSSESTESAEITLQVSHDGQSLLHKRKAKEALRAREALMQEAQETKGGQGATSDPEFLRIVAELSLLGGDVMRAREAARRKLKRDYNDIDAMNLLIRADLAEKKLRSARLLIDNALAIEPRNATTINLRGLVHYAEGKLVEARESWKLAQKYDPTHLPAMMNLAALYFQNKNVGLAGGLFEKVLSLKPDHLDARVGFALVRFTQGDKEQARGMLQQILDSHESSPLVLYNLAVVERDGFQNYAAALAHMESFVKNATQVQGARQSVERGLAQVQSLKAKIASLNQKLSDEELRSMARSPGGETGAESGSPTETAATSSPGEEVLDKDVQSLEDAIK